MAGIIKLGTCIKCNQPVYADNIHGSPDKCNILLQKCSKGGDCEVEITKGDSDGE
jgi:hypothetical protein